MMRKRLILIVLAALLCLPLGLVACGDPAPESKTLQTVEITNKAELQAEWYVGDNDRVITLEYTPSDCSVKDITVVSSSDSVTVNTENNLKLRAAQKGTATITVTADGKTDSVTITVKDYDAPVDPELETVEITNKTALQAEWYVGDNDRVITLAYTPSDYTPDEVTVVSNSEAVTVDTTDKLKLHAAENGTATITVTADGKTDSVTVIVIDNRMPPLDSISINSAALTADWYEGEADRAVVVTYDPSEHYDSTNTPATVTSNNTDAVEVTSDNKLHANAAGTATITVTAGGKEQTVTVTVKPMLKTVTVTNTTALTDVWFVGDADRAIEYTIAPSAFTTENTNVSIVSNNTDAVEVTNDNKLHAKAVGTAKITLTVTTDEQREGSATVEFDITVCEPLSGITLNESDLTARWIAGESTRNIVVTYGTDGYNSTNTPATASVTSGDAVTVNGLSISPVKAGTATVTVKVGSGEREKTARVTITVLPELNDIAVTGANVDKVTNKVDYNGTLNISVAPVDTVNYTFEQANIEVLSDSTDNVTVTAGTNAGEYVITANTVGQFTVSITARNNISKTLNINCVPTDPTLSLTTTAYKILTKENVVLDLTANACDSTDNVDVSVTVKDANESNVDVEYDAKNKKFALAEKGNYTVTVTAKDKRDNTKQQTATATVDVYRNVFKAVSGKKVYNYPESGIVEISYNENSKFVADAEQCVHTDESDVVMAQFDMVASKCYYAEATYTLAASNDLGNVFVGMTHSLPNDDKLPVRWLAAMVDRGDRNFKIKDIDMTRPSSEKPFDHGTDRLYRNQISKQITDTNALEVKISIARINECFYTFVNDQFVMMNTDLDYSAPTIPGIYGIKLDKNNADVTVSEMNWIVDQTEVQNKINQLYTSKLFVYNNTADANPSFNVNASASDVNFTTNSNFSDDAGGVLKMGITPYTVFDGDFKVDYDYRITSGEYAAIRYDRGAIFKVLPANHFAEWKNLTLAAMGVRIIGDNQSSGNNVFYHASFLSDSFPSGSLDSNKLSDTDEHYVKFDGSNECTVTNPYSTYPIHVGDSVHFAFERRLKADHAEYTYKITVGDKTITRVQQYDGEYWNDPAVFMWFNQSTHGTASNITWQTLQDA